MANRLEVEELSNGRVQVALRRAGQIRAEAAGKPAAFNPRFGTQEREDLRWYLEDYLMAPFAVYEERGRAVERRLPEWGKALFEAVFGPRKPGHGAYIKARENPTELALISRSPAFLSLPWELLQDPKRTTPLALDLTAIDRTFDVEGAAAPVPAGEMLRVLMVIARPAGLADVGYQMVARPLMERLSAVSGRVDLDVLRPPTFEAFRTALATAAAEGRPYHMVHFDGHGIFGGQPAGGEAGQHRGYLAFEAEGGGDDLVSADQFALIVGQAKVPLVVLNACQSGMVGEGEAAVEAAVATRLIESGAASVVAMGYSVYAVAAAEFMTAFYENLFAGRTVSEAVAEGRKRLYRRKDRPSPKGPLPLEDWIVPVHYLRSTIAFPQLKQTTAPGSLSLDALLDEMRPGSGGAVSSDAGRLEDPLAPVGHFVGRDAAFYTLELALKWRRVAVVHGPAGTGKTELAKAFGRWWQATGGVGDPKWVFFHSFEPGIASFGLEGAITAIGLQLFGPDFIGRTRNATERQTLLLELLCERQMLLIWDNFESVHELPDPTGATPPLDEAEQKKIHEFLAIVVREGQSGVIVTSRTPETWLGDVRRVELDGLTTAEAAEMADDILRPYPIARTRRQERAFADLLEWINGNPLSLRLLLPQLDKVPAASLLEALRGNTTALPPGFVGEGRLASLGASLKYSFDHLTPRMRMCLPALALFEGVADENVLGLFSREDGCPAGFAGIATEEWSASLQRLASIGLLTSLGDWLYGLHPALPSYLMAEWRRIAASNFAAERAAAERALLAAYAKFGQWLWHQIKSGSAEFAFALLDRHRRTMNRLLGAALSQKRYEEAQSLFQPLNEFWATRGMRQEAQGWTDRCRDLLEATDGTPPDLESDAGALWLFIVDNQAGRALQVGDIEAAYATYDALRKKVEALEDSKWRSRNLGFAYHKLGVVAHQRGDLDAAERWYRKSLKIKKVFSDSSGLASTYHQLGIVASERGNFGAAENWYREAIEIKESLGDRPGMAMTYHTLGIATEEQGDLGAAERWYRKSLEIKKTLGDRPGMASTYHQLGILAQRHGQLDAAERWYCQSLEIKETLGHRPGMGATYHQLGMVMQLRGDLDAAERWYRRSLEITDVLDDPRRSVTHEMLGRLAHERGRLDRKVLDTSQQNTDRQWR
ncbi:tetratricopeptide repeat protein [Rhizobium ruizarguesonis]|uniref:tetratricopeptide repeat protein n=1 Tax=Rhizobium ruizarguesonis TaxID=2081791 RepID=UPI00103117B6|nr:tetratricopeptide repeat protein [Rhizobium ruizarguesonis]TAX63352.1 tetratricopeptide repeat protein [Rhizobium ruizarguesonis]